VVVVVNDGSPVNTPVFSPLTKPVVGGREHRIGRPIRPAVIVRADCHTAWVTSTTPLDRRYTIIDQLVSWINQANRDQIICHRAGCGRRTAKCRRNVVPVLYPRYRPGETRIGRP